MEKDLRGVFIFQSKHAQDLKEVIEEMVESYPELSTEFYHLNWPIREMLKNKLQSQRNHDKNKHKRKERRRERRLEELEKIAAQDRLSRGNDTLPEEEGKSEEPHHSEPDAEETVEGPNSMYASSERHESPDLDDPEDIEDEDGIPYIHVLAKLGPVLGNIVTGMCLPCSRVRF